VPRWLLNNANSVKMPNNDNTTPSVCPLITASANFFQLPFLRLREVLFFVVRDERDLPLLFVERDERDLPSLFFFVAA
jgi:hypothetical protein